MKQQIRSQHIVTTEGVRAGTVLIDGDKIASVEAYDFGGAPPCSRNLDAGELYLLPGLIDTHVHINEPGRTEWEGFETATRAAAAGGFTCLVDMPLNCIPSTSSVAALEEKRRAAEGKRLVDVEFWGAVVPGNADQIVPLAQAGVRGYKCFLTHSGTDEFEMVTEADLRAAMPSLARTGLPLLAHAETPGPIAAACALLENDDASDWQRYETYLRSRPPEAELEAIRLLIRLCGEYRCRVHIVHLSSAAALPMIEQARAEGLPLTVETCPHYLLFEAEGIPNRATEFKCAPPIREGANREALWEGLRSGLIDLIASDHSPCPPEMKCFSSGSFREAWGGISSLSLSLPAVWSEAMRRGFTLSDVVRWMAEGPARLAGLDCRKSRIAPGFDADLVLFDPKAEFTVRPERLHFRHPCTPYLGERLQGEIRATFVRGEKVFSSFNCNVQ